MTETETAMLIQALKRDVPSYYAILKRRSQLKRKILSRCINIASSDNADYQIEINKVYNAAQIHLSDSELILLNYICLIKHKEYINNRILKDDNEIQRWLIVLQRYVDASANNELQEPVISTLDKQARQIINQYKIKNGIGRPKGKGKYVFSYNGKEYHTIQECADDYNISKQGMHKRLRKLNII